MAKDKAKPRVDIPANLDSQSERELAHSRIEHRLTLAEERTTFEDLPFDLDVRQVVEAKAAALTIPLPFKRTGRGQRMTRLLIGPAKKWLERFMVVAFRDFFEVIANLSENEPGQRTIGAPPTKRLLYRENQEHIVQTDIFPPKQDAHLDAATLKSMLIRRPKSLREDWLAARAAIQLESSLLSSFLWVHKQFRPHGPAHNTDIAQYAFRQALDLVDELRQSKSVEDGPSRDSQPRLDKQQEPEKSLADAATPVELPLPERLAHVVLGPKIAGTVLELEKAQDELADLTNQRKEEIASAQEEFQQELSTFCDSFGRAFATTEESRTFSKALNARLRTLGYRLLDPETNKPATLTVVDPPTAPPGGYFVLRSTKGKNSPTSPTIPALLLSEIKRK